MYLVEPLGAAVQAVCSVVGLQRKSLSVDWGSPKSGGKKCRRNAAVEERERANGGYIAETHGGSWGSVSQRSSAKL